MNIPDKVTTVSPENGNKLKTVTAVNMRRVDSSQTIGITEKSEVVMTATGKVMYRPKRK